MPRALREAELAQRVAADFGVARHESLDSEAAAHHPVHYSRLPLRQWIAAEAGRGELTARRRRILRAFDNQAELLHTLVVYLASDMEVSTAADPLYVHPNTVRYRLSRVERALDVSLRSPQAVTDLMLCLEPRVAAMQLLLDQE